MKRNIMIGLILVAVGVLLILQKTIGLDVNVWNYIWPLFLIILGINMHVNHFLSNNGSSNLLVAGIITVFGALFLFNTATGGAYESYLTFVYPLGIAIGFFENYLFRNKKNSDFLAALILFIISVIVFLNDLYPGMEDLRSYIVPAILIVIGVFILIKKRD